MMRATAQFQEPTDSTVAITLTGTLGEFERLRERIQASDVPYYAVQALLEQISDATRRLRAKVTAEQPEIAAA